MTMHQLQRWLRIFHTIKFLKLSQIWYFFLRRGIGANSVKPTNKDTNRRQITIHPILQLHHSDANFSSYEFHFLNHSLTFPHIAMDWNPHQAQRLWKYNLHYFDFLRDIERPLSQKFALIDDWIAENSQGAEPAWEPYTTSLRIVNWCLFFWSLPSAQVSLKWLQSLNTQARWLERNLELHILANHYFENIKALLFAALFFNDQNGARWLQTFQKKLVAQLKEQTLADGGHYERSPQYHCILLEGYLDLYALLSVNSKLVNLHTLQILRSTIIKSLDFLAKIATPDDDIPLFNDSASGAASRPSAIFSKAQTLGFQITIEQNVLIDLPDSGLFGWKSRKDYFLIDCGAIGPNYQPGHTHCDFLSYVLMIEGKWLIVDSGLSEYEPGAMRHYVRSTMAHNTVIVDNHEQSEIWGEFRVGRRAERIDAAISKEGNQIIFEGSYRGFPRLNAKITHRRRAVIALNEQGRILEIEINDEIGGLSKKKHQIQNVVHLHPSLVCSTSNATILIENPEIKKNIASITGLSISQVQKSWHCPQFGMALPNPLLQSILTLHLPATMSYRIKAVDNIYNV